MYVCMYYYTLISVLPPPATWSANELVSANHSYGVVDTTSPALINGKMTTNLLRIRSISSPNLCIIRAIPILFICLLLTFPNTIVNARPMNLQNVDATKGRPNAIRCTFIILVSLTGMIIFTEYPDDKKYTASLPDNTEDLYPSEIQKAVCTVTAGDVKASAEAVTTKELKGVCRSDEMSTAFSNLELMLARELEAIKNMLNALTHVNGSTKVSESGITMLPKPSVRFQPIPDDNNNEVSKDLRQPAKHTFGTTNVGRTDHAAPVREKEILIYNNTLLSEKNLRVFTYYWKIENFTKKIENGSGITVDSPAFSIKGGTKKKVCWHYLKPDHFFVIFLQAEHSRLRHPSNTCTVIFFFFNWKVLL